MRDFYATRDYGRFDHGRMLQDLRATAHLFAVGCTGRTASAPAAFLERLGADILNATAEDLGALALKRDTELHRELDAHPYCRCFEGRLTVSWLAACVILGRRDLRHRFMEGSLLSWEAGMQWLVLHGANEHGLLCRSSPALIADLLHEPATKPDGRPRHRVLDLVLQRERPDKRPMSDDCTRFQDWANTAAIRDYGLYWLFKDIKTSRGENDSQA